MVATMGNTTMPADAIRAYLVELRKRRADRVRKQYSQEAVGTVAGMSKRSWGDYELGKTEGLRDSALLTVLRYLGGSFEHLRELSGPSATEAQGRALAELRAAQLEADAAEDALRATLTTDEWNAYVEELEQRARELEERARREQDRISRLRSGGA